MIHLRSAHALRDTGPWPLPDLSLDAGARVQLVGPSGSGKTTLLRVLAGLVPCSGLVQVCSLRAAEQPRTNLTRWRAATLGYLRHDAPLLGLDTAMDEALARAWLRSDAHPQQARQLLTALGVAPDAPTATLSAGERQRVGIARALVGDPTLVLLDEPFAHLDDAARAAVLACLDALPSTTTVLIASHGAPLPGFRTLDVRHAPPCSGSPPPPAPPTRLPPSPLRVGPALAARTLRSHRGRTLTLVAATALPLALLLGSAAAASQTHRALQSVAEATPVLISASPDPWRAALASVQLRGTLEEGLTMDDLDALRATFPGRYHGLRLGHTASGLPIVASSPELWQARRLRAAEGRLPLLAGEVALGSGAAAALQLRTGDTLAADPPLTWTPAQPAAPRLEVTGVARTTGSALDHALLTPLSTAWAIEGQLHSHTTSDAPQTADPLGLLTRAPAAASAHSHGPLPLSMIQASPSTREAHDLLLAYLATHPRLHAAEPPRLLTALRAALAPYAAPVLASLLATSLGSLALAGLVLQLGVALREPVVRVWRELGLTPAQERAWRASEAAALLLGATLAASLMVAVVVAAL